MEFLGDVLAGFAFAGVLKDLAFAIGERIGAAVPGLGGEVWVDDPHAAMNAAHGVGKFGGGAVLEEVAFCSGVQRSAEVTGAGEGGEDDDSGVGEAVADFGGEGEAGHSGHFDVGDEDVGLLLRDGLERLVAVGGASADGDVGFGFKEGGERAQHHSLIFGDDYLDLLGHFLGLLTTLIFPSTIFLQARGILLFWRHFSHLGTRMSTSISSTVVPTPRPRRPVGLMIAACGLALLACFVVLGGMLVLASVLLLHTPQIDQQLEQFPALKALEIVNGIVILLVGWLCTWTAVDLFRVRKWARISVLILGGMIAFFSLVECALFGAMAFHPLMLTPNAGQVSPGLVRVVFLVMAGMSFLFMLVGVWWLVYFNLKSVRAVFAAHGVVVATADAPIEPVNPVKVESDAISVLVSCLAVLYLLGAAAMVVAALLHFPMLIFSHIFDGNAASMILLFMAAVAIWMGIGLLRRIKAAWAVALVFNAFGLLTELWMLLPTSHTPELEQELLGRMVGHGFPPVAPNPMIGPTMMIGAIGGSLMTLAVFWLLWRAKPLFERTQAK